MNSSAPTPEPLTPSPLADGLYTARLANGIRVIIRENHRSPVAICNVWVRVGSNREPEKLRGWSHGIEHMLFKGTGRRDEGDFAREVAEAGGKTNAGTGYETTNYHITVPAERLPVAIDILADVLFHSSFAAESLDAERQVLVHENHMYDDIPFGFGVTWRWGMELLFDRSPYREPIGGRDENLLERDREDILAFFRSAYRPDNLSVVVVGDVDPEATFAELDERFGAALPPAAATDSSVSIVDSPPTEPDHEGCRLRVEHGEIQRAYAKLIFPAPGELDPDRAALSVVHRILADGRSCRLYRRVQEEKKLVDDFTVMMESGPREGLILVDVETDVKRLASALQAIGEELAGLAADGGTAGELDRARVRTARSFLATKETVQGQASTLGYHDALGDLAGAFDLPARIDAVTAEQVRALCRRTFTRRNLGCVIYLPDGTDAAAVGLPVTAGELDALLADVLPAGEPRTAPGADAGRIDPAPPVRGAGPIARGGAAGFETLDLAGGTRLFCRVDPSVPLVALGASVRGGALAETERDAGLCSLMQTVQVKGADGWSAEALHAALESEGASLGARVERDFTGVALSTLSARLDPALELLAHTLCRPAFSPDEIEQERRLALESLEAYRDNPFQTAALRMRHILYGDQAYGRPAIGTAESIPRLDRDGLVRRWREVWRPENLQIVVSGAIEPAALAVRLEELLSDLPTGEAAPGTERIPLATPAPAEGISERVRRSQNQSVVLLGKPGSDGPDEDRIPMALLKQLLNGQSGRLFEVLRNRNSLCYNTGSLSTAGFGQGMFVAYVMTAPDTEKRARDAMIGVIEEMAGSAAGAGEFEQARAELLGNLLISGQSNSARAARSERDVMYGRGPNDLDSMLERIGACSAEDVRALAERLCARGGWYGVTVGP